MNRILGVFQSFFDRLNIWEHQILTLHEKNMTREIRDLIDNNRFHASEVSEEIIRVYATQESTKLF